MPVASPRLLPLRRAAAHWRLAPLALATALGLGFASGARAQSLQELYEAARGYDASYLSARALLDSSKYRVDQANALRLPSVGLGVSGSRSTSDTPASNTQSSTTNAIGATLSGRQSLFNRANGVTISQAQKSLEVSAADFEAAEQDLIVRVAQAYFDVLAAQDTLATTRTSKAAISEQLASAKRNFEVGTATITDTREAQARFDLGTAQEIVAANDLQTKRIALDQLVGRSNVAPNQLAVPVALPATAPANIDEWVSRADEEHPLVRKARLGFDVARLETEKAKAGHLPTVDLTASYTRGHASTRGDARALNGSAQGFDISGANNGSAIAVTMNVPLFAGYAIQNRVKETVVLEDKARNDLEAARRGVAQGTRQAYLGVESGKAQVKALEAAESSTQLALEATQLGYRVGVRVNLDVLNAQTQLFQTRRDLAKARYDVLVGSLKLRQASGRLKPEDVAALNQLLAK
ncbi:MAG: TolC family outer membrane protein [Burkholderiales bacterium]|nr:TolC family outer membrane protein [Burkholderiales bacterium]